MATDRSDELYRALKEKGYPEDFCRLVEVIRETEY